MAKDYNYTDGKVRVGEPHRNPSADKELVASIVVAIIGKAGLNLHDDELDSYIQKSIKIAEKVAFQLENYHGVSGYSGVSGFSGYEGNSGLDGGIKPDKAVK